jgi:hypothetical protein
MGCPERGSAGRELAEMLVVAGGHGDDRRLDRHELAGRQLRAAATDAADAERNLVAAAPFVTRPAEHVTRHRQQDGIVVQAAARDALQPMHGLSERGERVGSHLESQHPRARQLGRGRVG